jgi:PhnB protein
MMAVTSKGSGRQLVSVLPQLSVRGGLAALDFYRAAFGAEVVYQVGGTAGNPSVVAQLSIEGASFWVADESPEHGNFSPESVGGSTTRMLLVVDDPQAAIDRAVAAGAVQVSPAANEHGWLLGRIRDPFGHHWEIGKPLVEWPPRSRGPHGHGAGPLTPGR